ncbi:hypothetical protein OG613_48945 (plasmid) [Streptomyces sp. NBC_00015]|uniref:hypothetical protein n=1 Tax=Streptomyces sp. NBC_00015 TaxID=2903611 RepID=UPI002F91ADF0
MFNKPESTSEYARIRGLIDVAETYAEDGAPQTAVARLLAARALIDGIVQPLPEPTTATMPLEQLVDAVEAASWRKTPDEVAAMPWVAEAINQHDPLIRALGKRAELARRQHQVALVDWIQQDRECTCVTHCAEDPATACSLSSKERHVHPALPGHPGVYGPCPRHPDAPGDL